MTDLNPQNPLELEVKNFGPIAEAKIDLRPFTVFVGPSNTGKSYLAILIYALHQYFSGVFWQYFSSNMLSGNYRSTFRGRYDMLWNWERAQREWDDLTKWAKHTFADKSEPPDQGSILLSRSVADLIRPFFIESETRGGDLIDGIFRCLGVDEEKALIRKRSQGGAQVILRSRVLEDSEPFVHKLILSTQGHALQTTIPENTPIRIDVSNNGRGFIELFDWAKALLSTDDPNDETSKHRTRHLTESLAANALPCLAAPLHLPAFYLPADRSGIMRAHLAITGALIHSAAMTGLRPSARTPMLSSILADFLEHLIVLNWRQPYMEHRQSWRGDLGDQIEKTILGGTVEVHKTESNYPRNYPFFTYRPEGWKNDLPLVNASSMVSELAPVVLYLRHIVEPGTVLIIEEPESHLHPAMQVEFTRQLAALVRAGVRVIITTHSEWVLEELANIVRLSGLSKAERKGIEGGDVALRPEEVGAWLFQPKNRPRGSVVKEIPLDDDSGLFPSGFDEVAVALHNNWAEISSRGGANG